MAKLSEVVDSLEIRITKLLETYGKTKQQLKALEVQCKDLLDENTRLKKEIEDLTKTCESLKMTNSILGSDQFKKETKLKINTLIREIDQCITQLSD
jgi:regulator of replication initiation timing